MNKEVVSYLKLMHGLFNTGMFFLFVYQATLGLRIRRSTARNMQTVRRHRRVGPVAAVLGASGFGAGMAVVYLDAGHVLKYPLHFFTGLAIVSAISTAWFISRKIKGPEPYWRNRHAASGLLILLLYCIQVVLGLSILL